MSPKGVSPEGMSPKGFNLDFLLWTLLFEFCYLTILTSSVNTWKRLWVLWSYFNDSAFADQESLSLLYTL